MKKILYISLFLIIAMNIFSQDSLTKEINSLRGKIFLTGKNTGKSIILRWAPGDPGTWHLSNHYGYGLERLAFRDSTDFFKAFYKSLTEKPLKPWILDDWEPIANEASGDDYAAIAAQAIYGERNKSKNGSNASFVEKAYEFENLYSMALLAADFSKNAATASGLRFEDKDIDTSMTYIYRVYSLASSIDNPIDTAYFIIKGNEIQKPIELKISKVYEEERAVIIEWDGMYNMNFSAYFIERSDDGGKTFFRLNKSPYIDSDNNEKDSQIISPNTYTDSVSQNYIKYYYRIIGINTFAEYSKPSKFVAGMGRDRTPPSAPFNIEAKEIAPNKMEITWQANDEDPDLYGFLISRSSTIQGGEVAVTGSILPKEIKSFIDTSYNQSANNYYFVYSVDTVGNANVALPQFGSIIDSIAPAPPTGLAGTIDTNGIVKITWKLGEEKDIYGYKVYFANQENHTFIGLNNIPLRDTVFTDTIPLNVLTENIFYRVATIDMARNISEFSDILKVKKPDIVPPVAPVFTDYKVTKDGIKLVWAMSSSTDVKTHYLYRREKESENWEMIYRTYEIKDYDQFIDSGTIPNKTYEYKIVAEDDAQLLSDISFIITLTAIDFNEILPVSNINAVFNKTNKEVVIKWQYPIEGALEIQIFRSTNGSSFHFIKKVKVNETQIIDNDISRGNFYEYTVSVIDKTKNESGFSPIVKIDLTEKK